MYRPIVNGGVNSTNNNEPSPNVYHHHLFNNNGPSQQPSTASRFTPTTAMPSSSNHQALKHSYAYQMQLSQQHNGTTSTQHYETSSSGIAVTHTTPSSSGQPAGANYHRLGVTTSSSSYQQNQQREDALQKIRASLQPYEARRVVPPTQSSTAQNGHHHYYQQQQQQLNGIHRDLTNGFASRTIPGLPSPPINANNYDFAQSNGVSRETEMLNQMVEMGFERDASRMALTLTQYRSLPLATDILLKADSPAVFRQQQLPTTTAPTTTTLAVKQQQQQQSPTTVLNGDSSSRADSPYDATSNNPNPTNIVRQQPPRLSPWPTQRTPSPMAQAGLPGAILPVTVASSSSGSRVPTHNAVDHQQQFGARSRKLDTKPTTTMYNAVNNDQMESSSSSVIAPPPYLSNGETSVPEHQIDPTASLPGGMSIFLAPQSLQQQQQHQSMKHHMKPPAPPPPLPLSGSGSNTKLHMTTTPTGAHSILVCNDDADSIDEQQQQQQSMPIVVQQLQSPSLMQGPPDTMAPSLPPPQPSLMASTAAGGMESQHKADYIQTLCNRVTKVLHAHPIHSATNRAYKRDSTASSTGSEPLGDVIVTEPPSFNQIMSQHHWITSTPSVSTESSGVPSDHLVASTSSSSSQQYIQPDGTVRCESPLPATISMRIRNNDYRSPIKPFKAEAFRFFMEQHIENVLKQHTERRNRQMRLEREMTNAGFQESLQEQMRAILAQKESKYLRSRRQKLNESMFTTIRKIGVGAFGKVMLVRKNDTQALYAMKQLRKQDVIKLNQAAHVKAERDILAEANSDWIVKLFYSFQDKDNLFLIMEYIPGGDLMSLLIRKQIFSEDLARFYTAELVCAIESVHRLGFIHRDIKPDNILIDINGHIKLTDFGLCTGLRWTHDKKYYEAATNISHVRQDSFDLLRESEPTGQHKLLHFRRDRKRHKAHSLVGTSNYMAPEVLSGSGHTKMCDWWSVGVILYEMVVGCPPFYAKTPQDTQYKVVHWRQYLRIQQVPGRPPLSPSVCDLILSLCCDQEDRLGRRGADELKQHEWFRGVNWENIRDSHAPHIPVILHPTDTSNFDDFEGEPTDDGGSGSGPGQNNNNVNNTLPSGLKQGNPAFFEYTFRHFFDMDSSGGLVIRSNPNRPPLAPVFETSQSHNNAVSTTTSLTSQTQIQRPPHHADLSMYV